MVASKAAFCAEFHALHSWNNKWSVRFQKSTKIPNTRCAPPQAREAPKKYYTLHYTRFKRIQVQVQIQVCHTQRHAAILNFNHAFTSLRRRKAPILKTIRADFAVIWKKSFPIVFLKETAFITWKNMIFHEFYPPKKCMLYMSSMVMQNRLNQRGGPLKPWQKYFAK